MAADLAALSFEFESLPKGGFQACARYYEAMDFILYLREDLPYRADRVDRFLTLLWHPSEDRAIGVKLKGFRYLFQHLQAIFRGNGRSLPETDFFPLISALEVAMVAGLAANVIAGEERKRLTKKYGTAKTLVRSVRFDGREIQKAA
jgi:hypothetical protein